MQHRLKNCTVQVNSKVKTFHYIIHGYCILVYHAYIHNFTYKNIQYIYICIYIYIYIYINMYIIKYIYI